MSFNLLKILYPMVEKDFTKKQKMIARLQEFTLMDDDFIIRFLENDKDCTQFVLQIILENKKLKVVDAVAQKIVKSLELGKMTEEELIETFNLTAKQIKAIRERV